jgi:hypothetical protein
MLCEQTISAVADEHSPVAFSARHWQPVRITNQTASMQRRTGTGGRRPWAAGGGGGTSGSIAAHSRSANANSPSHGPPTAAERGEGL